MIAVVSSVVVFVVLLLALAKSDEKEFLFGSETVPNVSLKGGQNNPGFLIHTNISWKGKIESSGCQFENFLSMDYGIRAWFINLFQKVNKGTIKNTNQMIDVLTPAGKDNPENARNNYKSSVAKAKTWLELGNAVFDFEANPDWKKLGYTAKVEALTRGLSDAVTYVYGRGNLPQYFNS